jgi:hypothetical protein
MFANISEDPTDEIAPGDRDGVRIQRGFIDNRGCHWTVYERMRRDLEGRMTSLLVFECSASIRCVRTYPRNWNTLSGEALESLSWQS